MVGHTTILLLHTAPLAKTIREVIKKENVYPMVTPEASQMDDFVFFCDCVITQGDKILNSD